MSKGTVKKPDTQSALKSVDDVMEGFTFTGIEMPEW
jgi:hypothetical protein